MSRTLSYKSKFTSSLKCKLTNNALLNQPNPMGSYDPIYLFEYKCVGPLGSNSLYSKCFERRKTKATINF